MSSVRVLICGEVQDNWEFLFSRAAKICEAKGQFHLLLCVGKVFSKEPAKILPYISGDKKVPLPTYFFGEVDDEIKEQLLNNPECGVHFLGKSGIQKLQSLNIAFLDGQYVDSDAKNLTDSLSKIDGDIDILVTGSWPKSVLNQLPDKSCLNQVLIKTDKNGDKKLGQLLLQIRPRYHICSGQGRYFVRSPYLNEDKGAGCHVTWFLSLGPVLTSPKPEKYLHALQLVPAVQMTPEQLQQKPEVTTECPYKPQSYNNRQQGEEDQNGTTSKKRKFERVVKDKRKTVFVRNLNFNTENSVIEKVFSQSGQIEQMRRGYGQRGKPNSHAHIQYVNMAGAQQAIEQLNNFELDGRELYVVSAQDKQKKQEDKKPVQDCWFCLANPDVDESLVVSVGNEMYLALDKGPVDETHVVLIPVEHCPSMLEFSNNCYQEFVRYMEALRDFFNDQNKDVLCFERFITFKNRVGGNHCTINVIAVDRENMPADPRTVLIENGITTEINAGTPDEIRERLRDAVGDMEYFFAWLPDGTGLAKPIFQDERVPLQLGRQVFAEVVGKPERVDWRKCELHKEEGKGIAEKFQKQFANYDIVMQEQD